MSDIAPYVLLLGLLLPLAVAQEAGPETIELLTRIGGPSGHLEGRPTTLIYDPGGRWLIAGSDAGDLAQIALDDSTERRLLRNGPAVTGLTIDPAGERLLAGLADGLVREWDLTSGRENLRFQASSSMVRNLAVLPGGVRIVTSGPGPDLQIWERTRSSTSPGYRFPEKATVVALQTGPEPGRLRTQHADGFLRTWETEGSSPSLLSEAPLDPPSFHPAVFLSADQGVATIGRDGVVRLLGPDGITKRILRTDGPASVLARR